MHATLAALCVFALPAIPAPHGIPMPYSQIVAQAETIFTGTVSDVVSRHVDGGKSIRTYVTLQQLTVTKGQLGSAITLQFEGGQVGDDRLDICCMPKLTVGERYLLYVNGNGTNLSPIVGFNQGAFQITQRNGREVLVGMNGAELIGIEDDAFVFAALPVAPRPTGAPTIGAVDNTVKRARPDVDQFEREMLREFERQAEMARKPLQELPAQGEAVHLPDVATPPAPAKAPVTPMKVALPKFVEKAADQGVRATTTSLLQLAQRAEGGK